MKILLPAAVALVLSACATSGFSLRPGASTESDVRGAMGSPAAEYTTREGTRELVYPRGPLGTQTYVASVGPDGVLRGVRNVLTDDVFNRIQPGLAQQEILEMIGPPSDTMHFPRSNTMAWDYRYVDTWGYVSIFSVTFDANGRVVSKISRRLERGSQR
jgi:hypothetical protein